GRAERFGAVNDEQIFSVSRQTPVAQPGEQLLDRRRVFRGSAGNPQNVLVTFEIHAHRAENVMFGETLTINVNHQDLDSIPAPFLQLPELLDAGLDGLPTDGAARNANGLRHLGQHFVVFARRNATHQGAQHVLAYSLVLAQGFVGRDGNLACGLVPQPRPLHPHFPVGHLNARLLRTVMPDFAAGLAGSARTGELFGAQGQDQLQRLDSDFMDNTIDYLARALDQVDDGEQDLA